MGKLLARLDLAFVRANQAVIILMMMLMAGLVFANVVARYVFSNSLNWSEELSRYLMIWITYLGAGLALREGQHVSIEYLQGLVPPRALVVWRALVALIILGFLAVLTVSGFQFAEFAARQRTPVLGWSKGAIYLAIPLGALTFGMHLLITVRSFVTRNVISDEDDEETWVRRAAS